MSYEFADIVRKGLTVANVDRELNWAALLDTVRTAQTCCEQWRDRGKLNRRQGEEIIADL